MKIYFQPFQLFTLIVFFNLISPLSFGSDDFTSLSSCNPNQDSCDYYLCLEEKRNCGERGYFVQFGYKYCQTFIEEKDLFSDNGKYWLQNVRGCLQNVMDTEIDAENNLSCDQIKYAAFKSHEGCYLKNGYCDLDLRDKEALIYLTRKALNPTTLFQGVNLELKCASERGRIFGPLNILNYFN